MIGSRPYVGRVVWKDHCRAAIPDLHTKAQQVGLCGGFADGKFYLEG
jgi:hypothetical protein